MNVAVLEIADVAIDRVGWIHVDRVAVRHHVEAGLSGFREDLHRLIGGIEGGEVLIVVICAPVGVMDEHLARIDPLELRETLEVEVGQLLRRLLERLGDGERERSSGGIEPGRALGTAEVLRQAAEGGEYGNADDDAGFGQSD